MTLTSTPRLHPRGRRTLEPALRRDPRRRRRAAGGAGRRGCDGRGAAVLAAAVRRPVALGPRRRGPLRPAAGAPAALPGQPERERAGRLGRGPRILPSHRHLLPRLAHVPVVQRSGSARIWRFIGAIGGRHIGTVGMVYSGTLFHSRQRGIPMHSYENRSAIRALRQQGGRADPPPPPPVQAGCVARFLSFDAARAPPFCQVFHAATVRAAPGRRLSGLSVLRSRPSFYGAFARARGALNGPKRRSPGRAGPGGGGVLPRRPARARGGHDPAARLAAAAGLAMGCRVI